MSGQLNEKRKGAIRLFEAMSGVDESYLAACEDYKKTKTKGVVVFMQKYGKGMAAVLCLAVLGAGYVSMMQVANSNKATTDCAPAFSMATTQEQCEAEESVRMEAAEEGMPDGDMLADNALDGALAGSSATEYKEIGAEQDEARPETETYKSGVTAEEPESEFVKEDDFGSTVEEITLEEARKLAVVGKYIPQNWPEDEGVANIWVSKNITENGSKNVYLFWESNTTNVVYRVVVENLGTELQESVQEKLGKNIIRSEEFGKEFIVANGKSAGGGQDVTDADFAVLHNNDSEYVLVHFMGNGSVEQIWGLLQ